MELYKYCDKTGVNILEHKALKVSRIDEFNDPYEFRIVQSDNEAINNAITAVYNYQKEKYRVLCFSSKYNNIVLWSHYARNHTGMLIKFDTTSIPVNGNKSLSKYLEPVEYKDDMIEIPDNFMDLDKEKKLELIKKNTWRKYTDWKYEGEYRGVVSFDHTENKRYIDLPSAAILEVVIGLHCSLETELNVKNILQKDEYRHVKLKRSFLHPKKYMMEYRGMNT